MKTCSFITLLSLLSLFSCDQASDSPDTIQDFWESHIPFELEYSTSLGLVRSNRFPETAEARGESDLIEASGIVISIENEGFLWTHEDKGNQNEIYLLNIQTGETAAIFKLDGVFNRDWEDIEIGPGPEEGANYIYLGEVGDNDRVYRDYKIYRFKEPTFVSGTSEYTISSDEIETITFQYPGNTKHDVETLLLDPWTKDLFLVTKRDFHSIIYVLPYPQNTNEQIEAVKVGEFPFTRAVGGNISLDGNEMLIKTYDFILHWTRTGNENMVDMFTKTPQLAPYNPTEPQGEAICFDAEKSYYTLSEFSNAIVPILYFYQRLEE
ncbi:hypothetical protein MM239_12525 [Belliella sp. DSM 111904]|uniref:Lipoprotein n=1 Tax=Belliella filtrata TaxID=2923435 RepID=A0ABS9V1D4_9BACT|nr:hypothetical protein [Belliella filtrata]MCH7410225.1 hypothetical protein [Belliella filtrata]